MAWVEPSKLGIKTPPLTKEQIRQMALRLSDAAQKMTNDEKQRVWDEYQKNNRN